eukprot:2569603-Lingulodinium_polyedra.AAC.1
MLSDEQKETLRKWVRQAESVACKLGVSLRVVGPAEDAGCGSSSSSKKAAEPNAEVRVVDHLFN